MIKNSVIALVTAALVAGSVAPAFAEARPVPQPSETSDELNEDYIIADLRDQGITATSVERWGSSYLVASIVTAEGKQAMVYLDPDTLKVVTP